MSRSTLEPGDFLLREAASSVVQLTAPVFAELARLADAATERVDLRRHPAFGEPPAWDALEPVAVSVLREHALITGTGLAVLPSTTEAGSVPSMAWWVIRDGEIRAKQHVLNPLSDSFYDITRARWFRVPYTTEAPTLLSPYVDSWGTDDVTMTAAAPLELQGHVIGVVAADLDVRSYVDAVERILAFARATAVLDEEERVVASMHPRLEGGARLAAADLGPVVDRAEITEFGWSVIRL
jgi:hypothetical protein